MFPLTADQSRRADGEMLTPPLLGETWVGALIAITARQVNNNRVMIRLRDVICNKLVSEIKTKRSS